MKRLGTLLATLSATTVLGTSCLSGTQICYYQITFRQENQDDFVVRSFISKPFDGTELPELRQKTGYDVSWSVTDFTSITESMLVVPVYTPKTYQISYNVGEDETIEAVTQEVAYDADYTLLTPTRGDDEFRGWFDENGEQVTSNGVWKRTENVTLTAKWVVYFNVIFDMVNGDDVVVHLRSGTEPSSIPAPDLPEKEGYTAVWSITTFKDYEDDVVVEAVYKPNEYTITYTVPDGAEVGVTTQTVVYDQSVTLAVPTWVVEYGYYEFGYWKNTATGEKVSNGKWTIASDVTLEPVWDAFWTNPV